MQQLRAAQIERERTCVQPYALGNRLIGAEEDVGKRNMPRQIVRPPSTGSSTPVMNRPASLTR